MILPDLPYQILDMLSDPMAVFDRNGLVVHANEAFGALEPHLLDPAREAARKLRPDLVSEAGRAGRGNVRKDMSLSIEGRTYDAFVYSVNKPRHKETFYLALLKPRGEEEAPDGLPPEAPGSAPARAKGPLPPPEPEALSPEFGELRGDEPVFRKALMTAQKAAGTDFPVLILGESGTGKEILARTIHRASRRGKKSFVDINCAAIPENLIESELFGYEKGAFTGAGPKGRRGLFEEAHEGSIFLDEIGDASLQIQSKVLRVLQEGTFKRVGGNRNIEVNVRHISATNRDLAALIGEGRFREDLFYRLNTITIELPPLRSRPNDIPLLIEHFLLAYGRREKKKALFSPDCLELMESYGWPGNVRELKGVVDYAVTMAAGSLITPDCLPSFLLPRKEPGQPVMSPKSPPALPAAVSVEASHPLPAAVQQVEKEMIRRALETSASRSEAIKALGISRRTFYIKIKQYGLG